MTHKKSSFMFKVTIQKQIVLALILINRFVGVEGNRSSIEDKYGDPTLHTKSNNMMTLAQYQSFASSAYDDLPYDEAQKHFEASQKLFSNERRLQDSTTKQGILVCNERLDVSGKARIEEILALGNKSSANVKYRLKQNNKQKTCIIVKKDIDFDGVNLPSSISIGTLTSIAKQASNFDARFDKALAKSDRNKLIGVELCPGELEEASLVDLAAILKSFLESKMPNKCEDLFSSMEAKQLGSESFMFDLGKLHSSHKICLRDFLINLSESEYICYIEPLMPPEITDVIANTRVIGSGITGSSFHGLSGANQVVQVTDSGLDLDSCYFSDEFTVPLFDGTVQPNARRVVQYFSYADSTDISNGHGTHVSGILAGKHSENQNDDADGLATDAKIAFFDVGIGSDCCYIPSVEFMLDTAKVAGASISSASWGTSDNMYTTWVSSYDEYLYNNQDILFIAAAGNSGGDGMNTVGSPAIAKNVIAVGATDNTAIGNSALVHSDSSRGPSEDGRIKPDLVAPGFNLKAAAAGQTCDTTEKGGTSMAAPVVSGAAAIIRQYFEEGYYPSGIQNDDHSFTPSADTIKAVLVNGATTLNMNTANSIISAYDYNQGHGLIDLSSSLFVAADSQNSDKIFIHEGNLDAEATYMKSFILPNDCDSEEMSVTMVYTDINSAAGCTECLINDLDLSVDYVDNSTLQTITIFPNNKGDLDTKNTIESIKIMNFDQIQNKNITVKVKATNIVTEQSFFSLTVKGCMEENSVAFKPPTRAPSPTPSKLPSYVPSLRPSSERIATNDYKIEGGDIDGPNSFTIIFDEEMTRFTVPMRYTWQRTLVPSIYLNDCETTLDTSVTSLVMGTTTYYNVTFDTSDVIIDFNITQLKSSDAWTDITDPQYEITNGGVISVCVRVDMTIDGLGLEGVSGILSNSVSYYKLILEATISLDVGFGAAVNVATKVDSFESGNVNANIQNDLQGCVCNEVNECIFDSVSQNQAIDICVYLGPNKIEGVALDYLKSMTISHPDSVDMNAVIDGEPNTITILWTPTNDLLKVTTRVITAFFNGSNKPLSISGIVVYKFSNGNRRLVAFNNEHRRLNTESTEKFNFEVELSGDEYNEGSNVQRTYTILGLYSFLLVIFTIAAMMEFL